MEVPLLESALASGRPFTVRTADGREFTVPTRDHLAIAPTKTFIVVFDDGGHTTHIPMRGITSVEYGGEVYS